MYCTSCLAGESFVVQRKYERGMNRLLITKGELRGTRTTREREDKQRLRARNVTIWHFWINVLKPTGHVMHQQV